MTQAQSIRISFDENEMQSISFLMSSEGIKTPQKLLRFLVTREAGRIRNQLRYSRKGEQGDLLSSPSANRAASPGVTSAAQMRLDRSKQIQEEMPLPEVTDLLKRLGVIDADGTYENGGGFRVSIALDSLGVKRERFEEYTVNNPEKPSISWGRTLAEILAKCVRDRMI